MSVCVYVCVCFQHIHHSLKGNKSKPATSWRRLRWPTPPTPPMHAHPGNTKCSGGIPSHTANPAHTCPCHGSCCHRHYSRPHVPPRHAGRAPCIYTLSRHRPSIGPTPTPSAPSATNLQWGFGEIFGRTSTTPATTPATRTTSTSAVVDARTPVLVILLLFFLTSHPPFSWLRRGCWQI